jgi:integrase
MYLTRRQSGFRFQIAVPSDLFPRFGRTPIRVALGRIPAPLAQKAARLLSGHAETVFLSLRTSATDTDMNRAALTQSLGALADELLSLDKDYMHHLNMAAAHSWHMNELPELVNLRSPDLGPEDNDKHAEYLMEANAVARFRERLGKISAALAIDKAALEAQSNANDPLAALIGNLQSQVEALSGKVQTSLDGGPARPLLSEVLEAWTALRRGLQIGGKKVTTDYNRIRDFMAFAGDKPLNKYVFSDFQSWSNLLVRVPQNHMKLPAIRDMSREAAADYNDGLPLKKRLPTLVEKTIDTNYLSPLRTFFREMAAEHGFRSPLAEADVRISAAATESVQRVPFEVAELNTWFAHAAREARADAKWLPLLATITGARIGELIFLQGKDVRLMRADDTSEHWVIDLRTDLDAQNGEATRRKTKTKASRRLIALHEIFGEVGFIDYARSRKYGDWLFPAAFRHGKEMVKDPADAASKRMGRMLREIGIHKPLEKVFHSSRHNAKDIMRMASVDRRTHDLQTGHALVAVSDTYGSEVLVHEEVEVLASLPLPRGLDLTPYMAARR